MSLSVPPGYRVEPLVPSSFDEVTALVIACDADVSGFSEFSLDDLHSITRGERVELETDSWLIRTDDDIVAFALLWDSKPNEVFQSFGVVRKAHQGLGLGGYLLDRAETRARERAVPGAILRTFIDIHEPQAAALAEDRGFSFVRRNWTMIVDFDSAPPAAEVPLGVTIRRGTRSEDDARLLHGLVNETFADHWGFVPRSYEVFSRMFFERKDADPDLWFFAYEGSEPIGVLMGQLSEDAGWVADLGVRREWRKRGIGEALLRHAFHAFYERGFRRVGLGVDTGNETGAVRLYERVGMHPARGDDEYEKALD